LRGLSEQQGTPCITYNTISGNARTHNTDDTEYQGNGMPMKYHRPSKNSAQYYMNYVTAMSRRRPDSVLEEERFENYLDREDVFLYQDNDCGQVSAVIGQADNIDIDGEKIKFFKVSHFAPATPRRGVAMLKKMAKCRNRVVVFTVTEDLCDMLLGCGFSPVGVSFKMFWNGEENTKYVFTQFGNETVVKTAMEEV
jgi:hypothetical protein